MCGGRRREIRSFEERRKAELRRLAIEAWIFRDKGDCGARPNKVARSHSSQANTAFDADA